MDKASKSPPQPSSGSSRGGWPNTARSVQNAATGSNMAAAQSHTGQVPGWHQPPPSVQPNGPGNIEEVARALRTIQDVYPFLVQSVAYHQQGPPRGPNQFPSAVPPPVSSPPPWPQNQSSTSHRMTVPQYTPDPGPPFPSGDIHSSAGAPYPTQQLSTPITTVPGESSFQAFPSSLTPEGAQFDTEAMSEEKRRRNTAASARFRVKKKMKTLNLERTVSDLSGRVDELEQEAADLKRENVWLKDIVMLKSGRGRGGDAGPSQRPSSRGSEQDGDGDEGSEEGGRMDKGKRSGA